MNADSNPVSLRELREAADAQQPKWQELDLAAYFRMDGWESAFARLAGTMLDACHRAENAVLWSLPERIREVDRMCDRLQLGEQIDLSPITAIGWGPGILLMTLETARIAEAEDPAPIDDLGTAIAWRHVAQDAADTMPSLMAWLARTAIR